MLEIEEGGHEEDSCFRNVLAEEVARLQRLRNEDIRSRLQQAETVL